MDRTEAQPEARLINILVSRQQIEHDYTERAVIRRFAPWTRLLIDSGAFTDNTLGRPPMDVFKWLAKMRAIRSEFLEHGLADLAGIIMLDVIRNPKATRRNYETILDYGDDLPILPVITPGASEDDIQRYLDTSDYIFIGGTQAQSSKDRRRVRDLERALPDTHRRHWLGFTRHDYMLRYRPFSVDSSSISRGARWPDTAVLDRTGKIVARGRDGRWSAEDKRLARAMGFDADLLEMPKGYTQDYKSIHACVSIAAHLRYAVSLEERIGTRYYIVGHTRPEMAINIYQTFMGGKCLPSMAYHQIRHIGERDWRRQGIIEEHELPDGREWCQCNERTSYPDLRTLKSTIL